MKKGLLLVFFIFAGLVLVNATGVSLVEINSTLARVDISGADDLYVYEISLDYSGTIGGVDFYDFLASDGASTTTGSSTRSNVLSVYESRLDSNQQGISGSGELFNVTHSGDLSLRYALFVKNDSTEEAVYYNASSEGEAGSGSGSGSGSTSGGESLSFTLNKDKIDLKLKQGERARERFVVDNLGNDPLSFDIVVTEISEFLLLSEDSLEIDPGEAKEVVIDFFASEQETPGVYAGKISVEAGSISRSINVLLEVLEKTPLFDVRSALVKDELVKGEPLRVKINLVNIGDLKTVDVTLIYSIKDFDGNEVLLEEETLGVDGESEIERKFSVSRDLPLGDYIFAVKLTDSEGKVATSANAFSIIEGTYFSPLDTDNFLVWVFAGILVLAIIILIIVKVSSKKKPKSKNRKKTKKKRK